MSAYLAKIVDLLINPFIQLLFFAAFIYFAWGIMIMILNADNETKRNEGKSHMMWGVVGMVIMVGAGFIFTLVGNTLVQVV